MNPGVRESGIRERVNEDMKFGLLREAPIKRMAACGGGIVNLQVYSVRGLVEGNAAVEWRKAILAGRNLTLRPH